MGLLTWARRRAAQPQRTVQRAFEAAAINRLVASWVGTSASIDQELRGDLDRLRMRARDLAANNDYVKRFLSMAARNIVGPTGFTLQARVYDNPNKPDTLANNLIESAFARWCRRGVCEVTGRMSFADLCRAVIRAVARDGEALLIRVRGVTPDNPFGYALQLIDAARIDTQFNRSATPGVNAVIMGVEVNSYGRPVAYWLFRVNPGDRVTSLQRERLPAEDVYHIYQLDRPEQTRGFPWLHTAMLRLHHLKGYEEAAIIASRIGAAKMGIYTAPDGTPAGIGDKQPDGSFVTTAEPGEFSVSPPGYDFKTFDPTYPHQQYDMFVKACLRGISSGLDISYNTLANDLEGVNFSSIRSGVLEERDQWMTLQGWFVEALLHQLYEEWLSFALLHQAITTPGGAALPSSKFDKFREHVWQARRWSWVDPLRDVEANIAAVGFGLKTRRDVISEGGADVEDVFEQLSREQALAAGYGLAFSVPAAKPGTPTDTTPPASP